MGGHGQPDAMFHRPSFQVLIKHSYIETLPSTGLFPPWPVAAAAGSSLGLRQVSPMAARTQAHGHHFPGSWICNGAARIWTGTPVGCQCHRWQLNLLCHRAGPDADPTCSKMLKLFPSSLFSQSYCFQDSNLCNYWSFCTLFLFPLC